MKLTFDELEKMGYPSVTDYCRVLVASGTPEGILEIYRGDMLCLTVNNIPEAAKIMPTSSGWKVYAPTPSQRRKRAAAMAQDAFK
jgi:hypothetical protein